MSRITEAKELVRQELLEALQNKSGDSLGPLYEVYDRLRSIDPMETGLVINFDNQYPDTNESPYDFNLSSDYLSTTNVETFGAAGSVNIDGIGEDVLDFGNTTISGGEGTDTISLG